MPHDIRVGDIVYCTQEGADSGFSWGGEGDVHLYEPGSRGIVTQISNTGSSERILVDWDTSPARRSITGGTHEWFIYAQHVTLVPPNLISEEEELALTNYIKELQS
jgi:hypothetical protein